MELKLSDSSGISTQMDFKFCDFFGISAPLAVMMPTSVLDDITRRIKSSVGSHMVDVLHAELQLLKDALVQDMETPTTVDLDSPEYAYFTKGLQIYLNSKLHPESEVAKAITSSTDKRDWSTNAFSRVREKAAALAAGRISLDELEQYTSDTSEPIVQAQRTSDGSIQQSTSLFNTATSEDQAVAGDQVAPVEQMIETDGLGVPEQVDGLGMPEDLDASELEDAGDLDLFGLDSLSEDSEEVKALQEDAAEEVPSLFSNIFNAAENAQESGDATVSAGNVPDMVKLGKAHPEEVECEVVLAPFSRMLMFFSYAKQDTSRYGLTKRELAELENQFQLLPVKYNGQVVFHRDGEQTSIDLKSKDPYAFQMITALRERALSPYDNKMLIDHLIAQTAIVVMQASPDTKKYMGLTFQQVRNYSSATLARMVCNIAKMESPSGQETRLRQFIDECEQLLKSDTSGKDVNLLEHCEIKPRPQPSQVPSIVSKLAMSTHYVNQSQHFLEPELNRVREIESVQASGEELLFPELADPGTLNQFTAFVRLLLRIQQFADLFRSYESVKVLFDIYKELIDWNNGKWMAAFHILEAESDEEAGKTVTLGGQTYIMAPRGFSIDDYTEMLCMDYNIVGVSTYTDTFFKNSTRRVGCMQAKEDRGLSLTDDAELIKTLWSLLLHLRSLYFRNSHPDTPPLFVA